MNSQAKIFLLRGPGKDIFQSIKPYFQKWAGDRLLAALLQLFMHFLQSSLNGKCKIA